MIGILKTSTVLVLAGAAIAMGGCATTESVEKAQRTADTAMSTAQHAQQTADQALSTAQGAQQGVDQLRTQMSTTTTTTTHRGQRG